jgi:hypothetical protein
MTRRIFTNDPPQITFTRDFRTVVHGDLRPGSTATLIYDAERLPHERSYDHGQKAWTLKAFYKFVEQGEVHAIDLWSETGTILHKITNDPGEGTMMIGRVDIPEGVDHLTLWFLNTGISGASFWDSNFGRNYIFRFVAEDLHVDLVEVTRDAAAPFSWFKIDMMAVADVSNLVIQYRIMNNPAAPGDQNLHLTPGALESTGERHWSGSARVPSGAVVKFCMLYDAYGNPHTDTNSGKGYLTWTGATKNIEAGVL